MDWKELLSGPPLRWIQPRMMKMNYQLLRGDEVITTLNFKSPWGTLATIENADGCWTFKRVGFFQTRATIRPCGSEAEIATFRNDTWKGGGTLEFQNGREILATTNVWQTQLEFREPSGETLMGLKYENLWCTSATVGIEPSALSAPEMSWMVPFGWYLMVMMQTDGAVVSAAVTPA